MTCHEASPWEPPQLSMQEGKSCARQSVAFKTPALLTCLACKEKSLHNILWEKNVWYYEERGLVAPKIHFDLWQKTVFKCCSFDSYRKEKELNECVCVCVWERERGRERGREKSERENLFFSLSNLVHPSINTSWGKKRRRSTFSAAAVPSSSSSFMLFAFGYAHLVL